MEKDVRARYLAQVRTGTPESIAMMFLEEVADVTRDVPGFWDGRLLKRFSHTLVDFHNPALDGKKKRIKRRYDRTLVRLTHRSADNPELNNRVNKIIGLERDYFGGGGGI